MDRRADLVNPLAVGQALRATSFEGVTGLLPRPEGSNDMESGGYDLWNTAGAQRQGRAVRSVCGREDAPDRIGVLIDVVQPHAAATLTVGFGTTGLDGADPCLVSYGVQAVEVYVR